MSKNPSGAESIEQMKSEMIGKFDALLRDVVSIDAAERDFMLSHLGQSLDDAIAAGATSLEGSALRGAVGDTVQMLQDGQVLAREDGADVQANFGPAFDVLQSDGVNRALEFARIAREQGETAARAWLRNQPAQSAAAPAPRAAPDLIPAHVASAIGRGR